MAPRRKMLAGTWRGPQPERYVGITWNPGNRVRHESQYPDRPRFTAVELADWSLVFKRIDAEHPKPGRNSFQALVGRKLVGSDQVARTVVYFVAYTKDHGVIELVSVRFANSEERGIFFGPAGAGAGGRQR